MHPVTYKYRLNSMRYAQCHVVITNDMNCDSVSIELISYSTSVCKIILSRSNTGKAAQLYASGTYTRTTAKHINRFTNEFCGRNLYHEVKKTCGENANYKKVCDINFDNAMSKAVNYMNGYSTKYYGGLLKMKYYRATGEFSDYFTGYTTIPGELVTQRERDTKFRYLSDRVFERVLCSKRDTYISFGARKAYTDAKITVL